MHEPTYLAPRHLLFNVQTAGHRLRAARERLNDRALEYQTAILAAAAAGASEDELAGYGVDRAVARELLR